jgi:hypothetical protein
MKGKFKMNELIKINYENADRPTVLGRDLHEVLGFLNSFYCPNSKLYRHIQSGFLECVDMDS